MTVQEAKIGLFSYFSENTYLKLSDYNQNFLLLEDIELNKEIVKQAALDLVKLNILREVEVDGETYFVLYKSLEDYEQDVTISVLTAKTIAELINNFREDTEQEGFACDPLTITDKDIQNLIKIFLVKKEIENND